MKIARRLGLTLVLGALLICAGGAQAASIWTPINSSTTDTISAVVYQSPTRLWYATTNGRLAYFNGSSFVAGSGPPLGTNFVDLAFQPGTIGGPGTAGLYGYAVTGDGQVWQTADGGLSWTQLAGLTTLHDCGVASPSEPVTELNAVVWAGASTVYLLGNNSTLERSTSGGSASPSFAEINKNGSGTCAAQQESTTQNLTDAAFLPSNPLVGFMVNQDFGTVYSTSNAFASGAKRSAMINYFTGNPRIAVDAANPNRLWVVDHASGGGDCGFLCFGYSIDGANTFDNPKYPPTDGQLSVGLYDVSSQGGTEVTAGSGGEIFTSIDGQNFYSQPADGALATENWRAGDAFDAQHAVVAGVGGAVAVTAAANTIPDIIPPTGTISGPTSVTSGQAVTYTAAVADNAGGSGINPAGYSWTVPGFPAQHGASATYTFPHGAGSATISLSFTDNAGNQGTATLDVTVHDPGPPSASQASTLKTAGAKITVYKLVTVTGRSGRYVPVKLSTTPARKFLVSILTRAKKRVVTSHVALKHKGHKTLHVNLSANVKPGRYIIVVRVLTTKGHHVGRTLKVKFRLV